jgi:oligopeptide transport system permease protein
MSLPANSATLSAPATNDTPGRSPWQDTWQRLRKNQPAVGAVFLLGLVFASLVGPWLSAFRYDAMNEAGVFLPPGSAHWFGTDDLGRDLLVRVLMGARISLGVGFCAMLVALIIGVSYGAIAGYAGGRLDSLMMRTADIINTLPLTLLIILLMVCFGRNIFLLFLAIGAVEWITMARIVRGQVQSLNKMEFIEAARALGYTHARIIFRHLVPNLLGPVIVYATLTIPAVMLLEAFLSFLGLGVQPPMSSWGTLIKRGAETMEESWWLLVFPGTLFSLTLLALNFLGDGLRDALDVRSAKD